MQRGPHFFYSRVNSFEYYGQKWKKQNNMVIFFIFNAIFYKSENKGWILCIEIILLSKSHKSKFQCSQGHIPTK